MKTVFLVLGILLIILFLTWLFLVKPGKNRKWMILIFDALLIIVSALVVVMGFRMRSGHIVDNMKKWDAAGEEGESSEEDPVRRLQEEDAQKAEGGESRKESVTFQEAGEPEGSEEDQGSGETQGTQGAGEESNQDGQGAEGRQEDKETKESEEDQSSEETSGTQEAGEESDQESWSTEDSQEHDQGERDIQELIQREQDSLEPGGEEASYEREHID